MATKKTSIDLDDNEVALIVGEEDGSMTVRVVPATEIDEDAQDIPEPFEIAVALAMRLLNDPEFHDDVLEWYESQEDEEDEDGDEDESAEPKAAEPKIAESGSAEDGHAPSDKPAKDA